MRVELSDETAEEIVRNWLVIHFTQFQHHDDEDMREISNACRHLLEINWPHLYRNEPAASV